MGRLRPTLGAMLLLAAGTTFAAEVAVVDVTLRAGNEGGWTADVTLSHPDEGWDHYADAWRITDRSGKVLGERPLHHPHVEEQPFTRSLRGVEIPAGTEMLYVEGRCSKDGWSPDRVAVDLNRDEGPRYEIEH